MGIHLEDGGGEWETDAGDVWESGYQVWFDAVSGTLKKTVYEGKNEALGAVRGVRQ